jgi:carbon storage regulator
MKRQDAMRIFTRTLNESINIGGSVSITVVAIRGTQVRLGVNAGRDVHIVRGEIAEAPSAAARGANPRDGGR